MTHEELVQLKKDLKNITNNQEFEDMLKEIRRLYLDWIKTDKVSFQFYGGTNCRRRDIIIALNKIAPDVKFKVKGEWVSHSYWLISLKKQVKIFGIESWI